MLRSNYAFTPLETRLFFALLILVPLKIIAFLFARGDGTLAPDPNGDRTYAIKVIARGGRTWFLWVDHADWIIDKSLSWVTWSVGLILLASVLFHRYRAYWRSKNEGRLQ
jgi:hypothetical protein